MHCCIAHHTTRSAFGLKAIVFWWSLLNDFHQAFRYLPIIRVTTCNSILDFTEINQYIQKGGKQAV